MRYSYVRWMMRGRNALTSLVFLGGLIITTFTWHTGSGLLREARMAEFQRDSDITILQIQQSLYRKTDIMKALQAFYLAATDTKLYGLNDFITRVISKDSPIESIAIIEPENIDNINIVYDNNIYKTVYENKEKIMSIIEHNKEESPFFIGLYKENRSKKTLNIMTDLDFLNVSNMLGGIKAWKENAYPTMNI